jgi:hypothetical protein
MSEGADIGFGIFLKTKMGERQKAGEMTEVLASQRYNAHLVPEDGTLTCSNPGTCRYHGVAMHQFQTCQLSVCEGPLFLHDLELE